VAWRVLIPPPYRPLFPMAFDLGKEYFWNQL
jgi:hypothetical protein